MSFEVGYTKIFKAYTFDNFLPVYPRRFHTQEYFQDVREKSLRNIYVREREETIQNHRD